MSKRQDPQPTGIELRSIISEFLTEYRTTSPKTLAFYQNCLSNFLAFLEDEAPEAEMLDQIGPLHVRAWLNAELGRRYTIKGKEKFIQPATVDGRRTAARRFFQWCIEQDYLAANPVDKVRPPRLPQRHVVGFDIAEVRRLMKTARQFPTSEKGSQTLAWLGKRDIAIVIFLLDTGARAGGLLALTEDDIDWPRNRVLLHEKGAKDRRVPMGARTAKAIKEYLHVRPEVDFPQLWVTLRKTPLDDAQTLDSLLKRIGRYADVPNVHAHRFRHTFAASWYSRNRDVLALRNLLGHSNIRTTERYLRSLGFEYGTEYGDFPHWLDDKKFDLQ